MPGLRGAPEVILELCERFGKDTYLAACQALLDRTLTMLESSTAMIVPVITEPAMSHLCAGNPSRVATIRFIPCSRGRRLTYPDGADDWGHTRA